MLISSTVRPSTRRCSIRSAKATSRCANGWSSRWRRSASPASSTTSSSSPARSRASIISASSSCRRTIRRLVTWPTISVRLRAFNAYEPAYDQLTPNGNRTPDSYRAQAAAAGRQGEIRLSLGRFLQSDGRNRRSGWPREASRTWLRSSISRSSKTRPTSRCAMTASRSRRSWRWRLRRRDISTTPARSIAAASPRRWRRAFASASSSPTLPVIRKLVLMKQAADLHSSTINQMAIAHVAERGFDAQVAKIKAALQQAP